MKQAEAAIITIGDELLIGQTIDTNSAYIAQELNSIGIWVKRRLAIGDVKKEILAALHTQSQDCRIVIITGGLGPTADDITKPTLCEFFGTRLAINEDALTNVKNIFTRLGRPLVERNLRQAEVPENCIVLQNKRGTAPGMWFERPRADSNVNEQVIFVSLPGVPNEMKGLMKDEVLPRLLNTLSLPAIIHKTILTSGIGESTIADTIANFEENLPEQIKLAYLPAYGMVRLRLTCKTSERSKGDEMIKPYFEDLKDLVKEWIIADEDITLAQAVSDLLRSKGKTVSTAESCTGGYIAHLITTHDGSSAVFKGSVVAYANMVKEDMLHVQPGTLQKNGAVSEETVREMVNGALRLLKSDYAIATSGIMGPGGGSEEKPVGTVWIAVGNSEKIKTVKAFFRFDRARNIDMTAHTALTMLFRFIKAEG